MKKVFIIAEAGINHNGKLYNAKKLIDIAKKAGADAVKFQTWITDEIIRKDTAKVNYQKKSLNDNETQYQMLKKYELRFDQFNTLIKYCKKKKIIFLTTAFDLKSLEFVKNRINIIKIPSGENNNYPLLKRIGQLNKNTFLSTGMSSIKDIAYALKILIKHGLQQKKITIMQCTTAYPTELHDVNLLAMNDIKKNFPNYNLGFSDHTSSYEVAIAAVGIGATVIEKHITINKNMKGPDHSSSLNFDQFTEFVKKIRNVEVALGFTFKKILSIEKKTSALVRKSIVAAKNITKGEFFTDTNITTKRPADGLKPEYWPLLLKNKKSKFAYKKNERIKKKEIL
jgi:N,N'-diacetyllegionaminate synthase